MNSRLRCRQCRAYQPREQFVTKGYCSTACLFEAQRKKLAVNFSTDSQQRRKPRQSSKVKKFAEELEKMRPLVAARSRGRCEGRVPGVCTGQAEHVHHIKLRSAGGDNTLANLKALCHPCHTWTHANPAKARAVGLLASKDFKSELDQLVDLERELRDEAS